MPAKTDFSSQAELGYRSKFGLRGAAAAGGNGLRTRGGSTSENVNPNPGLSRKASPRLGGCGANNARPLYPLASSRQHGSTFGTDITNIAGKADRLKPLKPQSQQPEKQLPQPQQPAGEAAVSSPSALEVPAAERQIELANVNTKDADEYAADINGKLFQDEVTFAARPDYMEIQTDLTPKMRNILMDWLIEVHMKYKLRPETLHLTENLIDRYLSKNPVMRKKLQLIGVVAMFIASKFEEINPPELHDWVYITDKAYTKDEVLVMEVNMLSSLSFQIAVPTAAHFFPLLEKANGCNPVHSELAQYIIELGVLDIRMVQHSASHRVSAALLLSNEILGRCPAWPQLMVQQSRHTEADLRKCAETMRQLFDADRAGQGGQLQAVHKKFSAKERHSVATMRF